MSREQCLSFGKALDLSEEEMRYLIQGYYDRSDRVFETEQEGGVYGWRIGLLNELIQEYLDKVHPVIRHRLYRSGADLEHSLRHIYYTDARSYLDAREPDQTEVKQHIASINYVSEFGRQMKLLGEIPRKTMIRHLLLFAVPFVSRELLSSRLEAFGYLPLQDTHTQVDGSRLDRLILGFLELYEENCSGKDPESCSRWFREAYGILDRYLEERGNTSLRFLYFKALKGERIDGWFLQMMNSGNGENGCFFCAGNIRIRRPVSAAMRKRCGNGSVLSVKKKSMRPGTGMQDGSGQGIYPEAPAGL